MNGATVKGGLFALATGALAFGIDFLKSGELVNGLVLVAVGVVLIALREFVKKTA